MPPTLTFTKPNHRLARLHDEILAALPAWATRLRVEGKDDAVRISLADPAPTPPRAPLEPAPPPMPDLAAVPADQRQAALNAFLAKYAAYQQAYTAYQQELATSAARQAAYEQAQAEYDQQAALFQALGPQIQAVVDAHDPAALDAARQAEEQARETLRQTLISQAQSAVGVALADLTAAQRNALVAALLHRAGAIAPNMTIRPLGEWLTVGR